TAEYVRSTTSSAAPRSPPRIAVSSLRSSFHGAITASRSPSHRNGATLLTALGHTSATVRNHRSGYPTAVKRFLLLSILMTLACRHDTFQQDEQKWRETRRTRLTSDSSWLTLVGLHWVQPGADDRQLRGTPSL